MISKIQVTTAGTLLFAVVVVATVVVLAVSTGILSGVAGIHPALVAALLLSSLIIAVCILGYRWQVSAIGEIAHLAESKAALQPHLKVVTQLLVENRNRLRLTEERLGNEFGGLSQKGMITLVAVRRIINALDERLETFVRLLNEATPESIAIAKNLRGEPLRFGRNSANGIETEPFPDLWAEQWAETLDSLFNAIEQDRKIDRRSA